MKKISLEIRKGKEQFIISKWLCRMDRPYEKLEIVYDHLANGDKGFRKTTDYPDIVLAEQLTTWYN